uniref:Potassium channel tetramerisation-type BTB domain-containing protein n=1 Tax=Catharus ustulatus TaxID=91951 RepID=A0A8C3U9T4_CATUS
MLVSLSPIVELNVGGEIYTTTLSTLKKHPGSKLAEMFTGQPKLRTDSEGRFFIDRPGTYFKYILEYLRSNQHVELLSQLTLTHTQIKFGFLMGRQKLFFSLLSTLESGLKGRIQCPMLSSYSSNRQPTLFSMYLLPLFIICSEGKTENLSYSPGSTKGKKTITNVGSS